MKLKYEQVVKKIRKLPPETIVALARVSGGDGHTIWKTDAYTKAGAPEWFTEYFAHEYESDTSDPKSTIFSPEGKVLPRLRGIYGLGVVEMIATALELKIEAYTGRGFRAQAAFRAIMKWKEQKG